VPVTISDSSIDPRKTDVYLNVMAKSFNVFFNIVQQKVRWLLCHP
jgi:hypothetical protein